MEVLDLALLNPVLQCVLTGDVHGANELCSHDATRNSIGLIPAILPFIPLYKYREALRKNTSPYSQKLSIPQFILMSHKFPEIYICN